MENISVKCPKCRLVFDVEVPAGAMTVDCVCPRCGMPFEHTLRKEEDSEPDEILVSLKAQPVQQEQAQMPIGQEQPIGAPFGLGPNFHQPTPEEIMKRRRDTRRGCIKLLIYGAIAFVIIVMFTLRGCWKDRKYRENVVVISDTPTDVLRPSAVPNDRVPGRHTDAEKAPEWIQGTWYVKTDFGEIYITIRGNKIAETTGGDATAYGTFYYTYSKLNCDFGDGKTFVYYLDEENELIDAGDGLLMKKLEN